MQKLTGTQAIKTFFEANGGRRVEMAEMQALGKEGRAELAPLCAEAGLKSAADWKH